MFLFALDRIERAVGGKFCLYCGGFFPSGPGEPLCWQIPKISTLAGAAAAEDGGDTAAKAAIVVAAYAAIVAKRCGYTWQEMEAAVGRRIGKSVPVITILLAIGFMLGGLMFSGTLPMLIYYGLQIVSPRWIALCAFLLCCIFSTVTGTSNGSASTAGLVKIILSTCFCLYACTARQTAR